MTAKSPGASRHGRGGTRTLAHRATYGETGRAGHALAPRRTSLGAVVRLRAADGPARDAAARERARRRRGALRPRVAASVAAQERGGRADARASPAAQPARDRRARGVSEEAERLLRDTSRRAPRTPTTASSTEGHELRPLLSVLSPRERSILRARDGLDGEPQSIRQIAERLGLSTSRVRDIERRALRKLRQAAVAAGAAR
jgi:RNA polymerase sigma factor (sigma-70 family)